uniref:SPK domain-containing protein n=1 Tax=Steinernema glaseri TaxID=37863 RepID=A0A1I7ZUQ0_9BILA
MKSRRSPYSPEEDRSMWKYLIKELRALNDYALTPGGNQIWEKYRKDHKGCARTCQSLASHYVKRLKGRVCFSNLPLADILYFIRRMDEKLQPEYKKRLETHFKCRLEVTGSRVKVTYESEEGINDIEEIQDSEAAKKSIWKRPIDSNEDSVPPRPPRPDLEGWLRTAPSVAVGRHELVTPLVQRSEDEQDEPTSTQEVLKVLREMEEAREQEL